MVHTFECSRCTMRVKIAFSYGMESNDRKIILRHTRCVFNDHKTDTGHVWIMRLEETADF